MRPKIISLIAVLILSFSCDRGDDSVSFRMKYENEYTIPGTVGVNFPFVVQTPPIASNSSTAFSSNNTTASLLEEISMDYAEISIIAPEGGNFSFLKSIRISIDAEGLNEIELASLDPVPNGMDTLIVLNASKANFKEYLSKDQFDLNLQTVSDEFLTEDYRLIFKCDFLVKARVLKD